MKIFGSYSAEQNHAFTVLLERNGSLCLECWFDNYYGKTFCVNEDSVIRMSPRLGETLLEMIDRSKTEAIGAHCGFDNRLIVSRGDQCLSIKLACTDRTFHDLRTLIHFEIGESDIDYLIEDLRQAKKYFGEQNG